MRSVGDQWLSMLQPAQKDMLLASAQRRVIKKGTVIVRRGAQAEQLYFIVSGKLKAGVISDQGRELTFDILGPDDVFGEVGLFAQGVRTADVAALEECEIRVLGRTELLEAMRLEPAIATAMLQVMAERIVSLSEELEETNSQDAGTRLARSLIRLSERFGVEPLPQNLQVQLKLSQQDLADLIGVSRVFTNTKLKAWQQKGILTHRTGQLVIHDLPALRQLAGY